MPEIYSKITLINSDPVYLHEVIQSLINEKNVILSDETTNDLIINYYNHLGLIQTNAIHSIGLNGFPINRKLNKTIKENLIQR